MAKDYIPRKRTAFQDFQKLLVKMCTDNALAWNIPNSEITDINTSSSTYTGLYNATLDRGTRTKVQVKEHDLFKVTYEKELRDFVNGFVRGNKKIAQTAKDAMGIKVQRKKRQQRSAIEEKMTYTVKHIGSGNLRFGCRRPEHRGKAVLHHESDAVEMRYSFVTSRLEPGTVAYSHISKRASFTMQFDLEHIGKKIFVEMRWKNLVNDKLSGPWTDMKTFIIA